MLAICGGVAAKASCRGFTLVEIVLVVVLLAFGALGITRFLGLTAGAYLEVSQRESTAQVGRIAIERVTRELRNALPGSIRVVDTGSPHCIEFMPIAASGYYLNLPTVAPAATFQAADFDTTTLGGGNLFVVVYALASSDVYAAGTQHLSALASVGAVAANERQITLAAPFQFAMESPARRFFIVREPVSFCASPGQLNRYSNYGITVAQAAPPAGPVLLAEQIQLLDGAATVTPFVYAPATVRRGGLVKLDFRFQIDAAATEWVRFDHELFVRNTP